MVRRVAFLIVVSLAIGQGQVRADGDESDAFINQGLKAMRKGDYQAALDAFQRAHRVQPTTRSRTEIGLAEQALHRWVEAESDLAAALSEVNDAWLEPHRPLIEKALADVRSHLGMLTIESGLRGAKVMINGEPSGFLPLPGPLFRLPGTVQVEIAAASRRPWRSEVQIKLGETVRLAPIFEPLDEPPAVMTVPPVVRKAEVEREKLADADPKALRVIGWLAVAAGAVAAGTGAVLYSRSQAGSPRRLLSLECLALGGAVVLSGGTIAVVTMSRSSASDHETAASVSLAGRF
jgi:tetratricopeptide (TPR) repeat protein